MGKSVKLSQLSKTVLIDQLKLCWKHFRVCADALSGADIQPVELIECDELGDCDDLELFYKCKKMAEEKEYLEKELKKKNDVEEGKSEQ